MEYRRAAELWAAELWATELWAAGRWATKLQDMIIQEEGDLP